MAKSKATKRKQSAALYTPSKLQKTHNTVTPPPDGSDNAPAESTKLQALVSEEEVDVTIETLQTLAAYPSVIKGKACKGLRSAVWDFRQACTTGVNSAHETNLTARISAALADEKYLDALVLLAEMRIRDEVPKLGALCRWVRDLDVVSGLSMQVDGVSHMLGQRSKRDEELLRVLDAILRTAGSTDKHIGRSMPSSSPIALQEVWRPCDLATRTTPICKHFADRTLAALAPEGISAFFDILETTPGSQRKPPNHHPAIIHTSKANALSLSSQASKSELHLHPTVANLSLISDVLSSDECTALIATAETIGFVPDAPIREEATVPSSVLAHNLIWLIDQSYHDTLWTRVTPHLPTSIGNRKVRGLNRRFRIYRYVPGAEYRCHIDGAWPPSGTRPATASTPAGYVYDVSPPDAPQSSLFTFLLYLNDDFEGGETTYFVPSVREGTMNAYPIRPVMGCVAVFPHGEAEVDESGRRVMPLLHEGTGVREGVKWIVRTEVLYDVHPAAAEDR